MRERKANKQLEWLSSENKKKGKSQKEKLSNRNDAEQTRKIKRQICTRPRYMRTNSENYLLGNWKKFKLKIK